MKRSLIAGLAPPVCPPERGIFCNRTLNLRAMSAIGYDMDYTLVHYRAEAWERRAYETVRAKLADEGLPVADLAFDPEVVERGLIIDRELGNIVKANRFGYVKQASHGTRMLAFDEQRRAYSRVVVDLSEERFVFLNSLFSLSEAAIYSQLVDLLEGGAIAGVMSYDTLHDRVRASVDAAHLEGQLKAEIMADPERFVVLDPEAPQALLDQRAAGKTLLLITNSEWEYTRFMMAYAYDPFLPAGMHWRDLFDLVIFSARKPAFFENDAPVFRLVDDSGLLTPCPRGITAPGVYAAGNAALVETYLRCDGGDILFVGDHIHGDLHASKRVRRWRAALVLRELEDEMRSLTRFRESQEQLELLMADKARLEREADYLRLLQLRRARSEGGVETVSLPARLAALRARLAELDDAIGPLARLSASLVNERWGLLLRTGNDKSHLARQIERHADVYTSRVSNFCLRRRSLISGRRAGVSPTTQERRRTRGTRPLLRRPRRGVYDHRRFAQRMNGERQLMTEQDETRPAEAVGASPLPEEARVEAPTSHAADLPSEPLHREVEAKFAAPDTDSVRALMWEAQPLAGFEAGAAETHIYTDKYFDTDALDLLRRGYALRVRRKGEKTGLVVALKGLPVRGTGPVHDRFEFQGPVAAEADAGRPESWPVPVRAMVEYLAGHDAAVRPVCEIRQRRVERALARDNAPVALLSVDEVAIVDPAASTPAPAVARFTEVEAERSAGASPTAFGDLVAALSAFPVLAQRESKLERGLAAVADRPAGQAELDGITPDMTMAEAGRLIWRRQLMAMALNEAGARIGDDIEYVHDMRVATRRARSAAHIFGGFFAGSAVRPVNKGLRRTAAMLGEVRDLDVALDKLETTGSAATHPELALAWRSERAAAVSRLIKWLDSRSYRRFLAHFAHLATTQGLGARDYSDPKDARYPHQVRHVFPAAMMQRYATVRAYETVLATADLPVAVLHLLRIDCKRMRYVLEPITHLLGDSGDELVRTLKRLQDALGELNDADVAKSRLLKMAVQGRGGPGLADYIAHQDNELERWQAEVADRWGPFVDESYRRMLAEAAARL